MLRWFRSSLPPIESMASPLPRGVLLQRGRIAILDDEEPEMLTDLKNGGFAITHIRNVCDPSYRKLEDSFFDLLLLDYGGIGARGSDDGLDVLRHLKRINPALKILAYTGRTFDASKADFFRLCDDVLPKDCGVGEAMEKIERHLGEVLTPAHQWQALVKCIGSSMAADSQRKLQTRFLEAAQGKARTADLVKLVTAGAKSAGATIIEAAINNSVAIAMFWFQSRGA